MSDAARIESLYRFINARWSEIKGMIIGGGQHVDVNAFEAIQDICIGGMQELTFSQTCARTGASDGGFQSLKQRSGPTSKD